MFCLAKQKTAAKKQQFLKLWIIIFDYSGVII